MLTQGIFQVVLLTLGYGRVRTAPQTATTCEEFERGARFNPYEVVDSRWKIIFFWSDTTETRPINFALADKKKVRRFQAIVDAVEPYLDPEWHKATLVMEPRPGIQVLLLYQHTPGAFRAVVKMDQRNKARPHPPPLIKLADTRFKLEGRFMGMMCCEDQTGYVLVRADEVPATEQECVGAAALLGFRGAGGRSYLWTISAIHGLVFESATTSESFNDFNDSLTLSLHWFFKLCT